MCLSVNGRKPRPILELPLRFGVPTPIWRSPGCSYTLLGFPGDVCVVFFNVPPGNICHDAKSPHERRKQSSLQLWRRALIRSTKRWIFNICEIFKVCGIESLKYVREFYTPVCYWCNISTPRNVTLNETNCDWLFDMSVKRPHGRALANESCHGFQTFSSQSESLATRDYFAGILWEVTETFPM